MLPYFVNVTNFPWNHSTLAFLDCKWHVTKEVSGMAKMKNHRFLSILFNFPQQILYRFDRLSFVIFWPLASLGKIQTSFSKHRRYWVRRYTMLLSSHMHHTRKTTADAEKPLLRTRRGSQFAGGLRSRSQLLFFFTWNTLSFEVGVRQSGLTCVAWKKKRFWRQKSGKTYNKCFWLKIHTCLKHSAWFASVFGVVRLKKISVLRLEKNQGKIEWFFLH